MSIQCSHLTRHGRPCRNRAALGTNPPACARHRGRPAGKPVQLPLPLDLPPQETRVLPPSEPAAAEKRGEPEAMQMPLPLLLPPDQYRAGAKPSPWSNFYFPAPTAGELKAIDDAGLEADLRPEVVLVRVVLRRLLAYLNENAGELPPDELRRVAGLVFSGARTVAQLLNHQSAHTDDAQQWLAAALAELSPGLPEGL